MRVRAAAFCAAVSLFVPMLLALRVLPAVATSRLPCGVFAGTVGTHAVVAEFCTRAPQASDGAPPRPLSGAYYYRSSGIEIMLEGVVESDGALRFDELAPSANSLGLARSGDVWRVRGSHGNIVGSWCRACSDREVRGSSKLSVNLAPLGALATNARDEHLDAYHLQVLAYPLSRSAQRMSGSFAYRVVTDDRYGASSIELTKFADEAARLQANRTLAVDLGTLRLGAFECLSDSRFRGYGGWRERAAVTRLTSSVLSLDVRLRFSCGGPYPTLDASRPITLDLRSGDVLDWSQALQATALAAFDRRYVRESSRGCASVVTHEPHDYERWFTASGLAIRADFPHVIAECNIVVTIPFSDARPLFRESYRALL